VCLLESEDYSHFHSRLEWEVIVVDDNSPDGTQEIAKQLAKVYGEDKIVSEIMHSLHFRVLKGMIGSKTACRKTRSRVCCIFC
jgi:glycosyltransferase involved in cell wall biosynthesis